MRRPNWDQSLCGGALPSLRQEVSLGILECWDFSLCECGGRRNISFSLQFFFKRSNMMGEGFAKVEIFGIIRLQVFLQEGQPYFRKQYVVGRKLYKWNRMARFRDHVAS